MSIGYVMIDGSFVTNLYSYMCKHATYDLKLKGGIKPKRAKVLALRKAHTYDPTTSQASGSKNG